MAVMTFIGMWIAGDLTLIGKDLIRVLLGPGWEEAGRIFVWFAPGIGVMMLYGTHGWIHLSMGRADRWLRWGLIEWTVTILFFLAAIHWGPRGIAAAWCASFWILTLPAIWFAGKPIGLGVDAVVSALWRYVVASSLSGVVTFLAMQQCTGPLLAKSVSGAILRIVLSSISFSILYITAIVVLHRGVEPVMQLNRLFRTMVSNEVEEEVTT